jgi:ubiquinone/menaquinone biosynthesis C-methylase UbiE
MDYDATQIPSVYDKGRDHGPALLNLWMDAVASHVQIDSINTILDLGCGTGRFTGALADHFNAEVIGIDPSTKMLEQAQSKLLDPRIRYASGSGEAIPLPDNTVDLIFMSMIFHHFDDPSKAARECRRVLRKGQKAFLRTGTRDHISAYAYVDFFPESLPILNEVLPASSLIQDVFEAAGFQMVRSEAITQTIAPNYEAYAEKLAAGADSVLARLNKFDFETGLIAMRAHAASVDVPVVESIEFFVFS